jgi:peptidoglycan/LPS O-acetylase OafA/YrhL
MLGLHQWIALNHLVPLSNSYIVVDPAPAEGHRRAIKLGESARPPLPRVVELDGIRGIAILLVLVLHFGWPVCPPGILSNILGMGWAGVDLFFVLSGFLITGILLDSKGKSDYFRRFYLRRVFRIFPIYYTYLILFFHIVPLVAHATGRLASFSNGRTDEAWFLIYLSNWRDAYQQNGHLYHFWSLSIEEQFYIVWPLVIYLIPSRKLPYVCLALATFSVVFRFLAGHAGVSPVFIFRGTPCRLDGLALGALLACAARNPALQKRVARLISWAWPVAAAGIVCLVIWVGPDAHSPAMSTFGYPSVAVVCCALILWSVEHSGTERWVSQFLRGHWLVQLGKYSYGAYVWHPLFAGAIYGWEMAAHRKWGLAWSLLPIALLAGIATSFGVAWLSWRLIEKPCAHLKERLAA